MKKLIAFVFVLLLASTGIAHAADETSDKIDALQRQLDSLKAQLDQLKAVKPAAAPAAAPAGPGTPVVVKPGPGVTLQIGGEAVTVYGNLDLSLDTTSKGLQPFVNSGSPPVGNTGWMTAISTNSSYIGIRGNHKLGNGDFTVPYQLETQLDVSATSGTVNTSSNNDDIVKGALTSRNSFVGIGSKYAGAIKIGKTDAPYKNSTARMNPFNSMIGDYSVIMGNTGGDNRVEFGTRLDHAIWYDSPDMHGFTFSLLASPGQNRSFDDSLIASGEASCAGGNVPGSGALSPACNDGSFGSAYSGSAQWQMGKLYATAAYELHKAVNRSSDIAPLQTDPTGALIDPTTDVADEDARKFGIQYAFSTRTIFSALFEDMRRYVAVPLISQNERSRTGTWFAFTQYLGTANNLNFGWAHANPSPGDPGQHNTQQQADPDNISNLYTVAFKHIIDPHVSWYANYAVTANHRDAHYDLGAGGHGVTTDCHDATQLAAFDPTTGGVTGGGPHCYAGGVLRGASLGMQVRF
jgi:predicted porin